MNEPEVQIIEQEGFPVFASVDGETQEILRVSQEELETLVLCRGDAEEKTGFKIKDKEISKQEFNKINIKDFKVYDFPVPKYEWVKWFGRIKKLERTVPETTKKVYYKRGELCYLEDLIKDKYYTFINEETFPSKQERTEYDLLEKKYEAFLQEYNVDKEVITDQKETDPYRITSRWGDSDKVDMFSNISEEQRRHITKGKWVAAKTWSPDIFIEINRYLKYGHAVDGKLMDKQQQTIVKIPRNEDLEEKKGFGL
jgi:hypothetical protein